MKKDKLLIIFFVLVCVFVASILCFSIENIFTSKETKVESLPKNKNASSIEIPELYLSDEVSLEPQEVEAEGFKLQGEVAYESGEDYQGSIPLGDYAGLTYYSQIDFRWKNNFYTSVNNSSQTIGSSGCGPTCAAMIVSSITGNITPSKMAEVFVERGFRSSNNGTYWSAFRWIADYFDIEYKETYKLNDVIEMLNNDYLVVAACGNGLFTTGGHFVTLVGIEGNVIKVYDPYLYSGKFNTSTRRGKATVSGNTISVTTDNFRNYANYTIFFCFKNSNAGTVPSTANSDLVTVSPYKRFVKVNTSLNVRSGPGTNYSYIKSLYNGNEVTIYAENGDWSKIGDNLWVHSNYLQEPTFEISRENSSQTSYKKPQESSTISGFVKVRTSLNVRSGPGTNYSYIKSLYNGASITIYETKNGWYRIDNGLWVIDDYITISVLTSSSIGNIKYFKSSPTYIYSKSNLTGNIYTYLKNTKIQVLESLENIDKIYVPATGRTGYVKTSVYK